MLTSMPATEETWPSVRTPISYHDRRTNFPVEIEVLYILYCRHCGINAAQERRPSKLLKRPAFSRE